MKEQDFYLVHQDNTITRVRGEQYGRYEGTPWWWIDPPEESYKTFRPGHKVGEDLFATEIEALDKAFDNIMKEIQPKLDEAKKIGQRKEELEKT